MNEKILLRCLIIDSLPYKCIKVIKASGEISVPDLRRRLKTKPCELYGALYSLIPTIEIGRYVTTKKEYDFLVVGNRRLNLLVKDACDKYNEKID